MPWIKATPKMSGKFEFSMDDISRGKVYKTAEEKNKDELIDVAKSSIEEICTKLPLRIQCIRIAIIQFKKDSENETVEPIEIEVSR